MGAVSGEPVSWEFPVKQEKYREFPRFVSNSPRKRTSSGPQSMDDFTFTGQMNVGKGRGFVSHAPAQHLSSVLKDAPLISGVGGKVMELVGILFKVEKQGRKGGEVNVFIAFSTDDVDRALLQLQSQGNRLINLVGAP